MPTIEESSIDISADPIISLPSPAPVIAADSNPKSNALRSTLPYDQVLDTVTAAANDMIGAVPVWKITPPTSNESSSVSTSTGGSSTSGGTTTPSLGTPREVYGLSISQEPYKNSQNGIEALITVSFSHWPGDAYFGGVQIWFTGYQGSAVPQLMAQGRTSPLPFTCEPTGETVTVTVVSYSPSGITAEFANAPTATTVLNGQETAPPAPSINQALVALAGGVGWQFSWNVENGLLEDVVAGYWVYKSSSSSTPAPPASRYHYYAQPATNIGTIVFQDIDSGTEYYWVSAVSVGGHESSLVAAQGASSTASYYPTSSSGTYSAGPSAYDGNEASSSGTSLSIVALAHGSVSASHIWTGFGSYVGTPTAIKLKVLSDAYWENDSDPGLNVTSNVTVSYSLDGGTTWTNAYSLNTQSVAKQYSTISLPTTQNLGLVRVQASCSAHSSTSSVQAPGVSVVITHSIYEVRIEVTE